MARDRQRSKARQRQQQRRDERLAQRASAPGAPSPEAEDAERDAELEQEVDRMIGAPVHDLGTSSRTTSEAEPEPSFETDDESLFEEEPAAANGGSGDDGSGGGGAAVATGPRGHRGGPEGASEHKRGRLVAFLVAVWAELQRVQWPDRRQLTQLTGVVLFFVLIVGAYLGGLDAIFSKLIQAIL